MATEGSWAEVNVKFEGFSRLDFDKKKIRVAMRVIGRAVAQSAKGLVSKKGKSSPGENPGRNTGALRRSIRYKISRPGFLVRIAPFGTKELGENFYPAYLHYGVKTFGRIGRAAPGELVGLRNRRLRGQRAALVAKKKASKSYRIAPRANYMVEALEQKREHVRKVLRLALEDALVPRK